MLSCDSSYCRVLELLLKNEARAGMTDNQGFNAIHYAGLKGHRLALEMVRIYSEKHQLLCDKKTKSAMHPVKTV